MRITIGRIVIAVLAAEIVGIVALFALVAIFGPSEQSAAQAYAERLGLWVGPLSGFVGCVVGAMWVTQHLATAHVANGLVLGILAAALDIALLAASGAPIQPIFVLSNLGRVAAGVLGGWAAGRRHA